MEREAAGGSSSRESREAREALDPEDVRKYRACLEEAEKGNAQAQLELGFCLFYATGVARDLKESLRWYRKAAKKGIAPAQYFIGLCLENGEGGRQDADEAAAWYRKAAEQGFAAAQCSLANCLKEGKGIPRDVTQAVVWFRRASEQGDAAAQNGLGVCLVIGEGVARNPEQAVVWFRKAAEQGNTGAQYLLGVLLLTGAEGVPKDAREGARSLGAAAQQGYTQALERLAKHAGEREVAAACCLGCGATAQQACSRCLVARFCSQACIARTWPVHKPHCKCWQAEATAAAESGA